MWHRFLRKIQVRNYKSIASADVELSHLSILIGATGAGKSNLLDVVSFLSDALRSGLAHAVRVRGGIDAVRRRTSGAPTHLGARFEFTLRGGATATYAFHIGSKEPNDFEVLEERCEVHGAAGGLSTVGYHVVKDTVSTQGFSFGGGPHAHALLLPDIALLDGEAGEACRMLIEQVCGAAVYDLSPAALRRPRPVDGGERLLPTGSNLAAVIDRMGAEPRARLLHYLQRVAPGVTELSREALGSHEGLILQQEPIGQKRPWRFPASSMGRGTLAGLGVLCAAFQDRALLPVVGIENIDAHQHPAASAILLEALREASEKRQLLVSAHTPDLLDDDQLPTAALLAVTCEKGVTHVGPLSEKGRALLRDRLRDGDRIRMNALLPEPTRTEADADQLKLFAAE